MADSTLAQDSALDAIPGAVQMQSVCAVTVTFGDRQHLLRPVLLALLREQAVWKIIVVSNAAKWNVQALASELAPDRIEVLEMGSNRGSSAAYAAGIKRACEVGTDFIWLLDDDNEPQKGALSELLSAHARLNEEYPRDRLAVLPYRADQLDEVVSGWRLKRRPSSFWGFHVLDIPRKLWRKSPWGGPHPCEQLPRIAETEYGPFGGMLFHRAVVEKYGLPRADFVLYADDVEFTYRITSGGGALRVVTSAAMADLEPTGQKAERCFWGSFQHSLKRGSDSRKYYDARNRAYLDSHCFPRNRFMFWINRQVYCSVLWLLALAYRNTARYRLLRAAIKDGLRGRMGMRSEYPL